MRTQLTIIVLLLTATTIHAQPPPMTGAWSKTSLEVVPAPDGTSGAVGPRSGGTVLWSEDFENGLGGWTVQTSTGTVDWQLTDTGNNGGFTPGPLQSTTGFPGGHWIVADSDLNGVPNVQENSTITSPLITGLDTVQHMLLRFEQSFRQLNSDLTQVEVSGDGGSTWTLFPVNTNVAGNQSTPGAPLAEVKELDISPALMGGSGRIKIRFHWFSSEGYTYSWQVDDIQLLAAEENDLRLERAGHSAWDLTQGDFKDLPYSVYPASEVRPITFKGVVSNIGSNTQTNVQLVVDIDGPTTNNVTLMSPSITLAPGAIDSLLVTGYTIPAVNGTYAITYTVTQTEAESSVGDNTVEGGFSVTPYTFARDLGILEGDLDNGGDGYELGNWYHITDWDNTLYGVDVALSNRTDPGTILVGVLYDEDRNIVMESEEHIVSASELNDLGEGQFISLPLLSPVDLVQNKDYFVALRHYGGTLDIWTATSGTSIPQTSLLLDYSDNTWYYVTVTPMVRMAFDPTLDIAERTDDGDLLRARPSVFQEFMWTDYSLTQPDEVSFLLRDMTGRVVLQEDLGQRPAGLQQFQVNGAGLSEGVYLLELRTPTTSRQVRVVRAGQG